MAGKSVSGALNASFDLLFDRRWVICQRDSVDSQTLLVVEQLVRDCGATPIYMSAAEHDEAVAFTSHLPQILASVLAKQLSHLSDDEVAVSGPGLRDMTRLASSDVALWTQIVKSNSRFIGKAISGVLQDLTDIQTALSTNALDNFGDTMREGQAGRARVPGKHGQTAELYEVVPVLIDDRPGQLAAIFRCAEKAEVNIEDVRIDHALGRQVAIVELSIKPEKAKEMRNALLAEGWTLRPSVVAD
jgi:prephenate dehydrogenase